MEFRRLDPSHHDTINDVVFDYYGKRIATCSSDRIIKVWTLNSDTNSWSCVEIKGHGDIIWRLSWAHPEFGQIIASASDDSTVKVWEELEPELQDSKSNKSTWQIRSSISSPTKKPIKDVKFSHKDLGLRLAFASVDGYIYCYEARDVFDLSSWDILFNYQVCSVDAGARLSVDQGLNALCWNMTPFEEPRIATGGYGTGVRVYIIREGSLELETEFGQEQGGIVVSDIAWAPVMGRSYHLIAVASRQPFCKIYKLAQVNGRLDIQSAVLTSPDNSDIWRLSWNATGTLLATTSQNGRISFWRKGFDGQWDIVQTVNGDNKSTFIPLNP